MHRNAFWKKNSFHLKQPERRKKVNDPLSIPSFYQKKKYIEKKLKESFETSRFSLFYENQTNSFLISLHRIASIQNRSKNEMQTQNTPNSWLHW